MIGSDILRALVGSIACVVGTFLLVAGTASAMPPSGASFEPHTTHFRKVCANAGPKVFRQVRDVEGIVVFGLRPRTTPEDLADKGFKGDVYSGIDTAYHPPGMFAQNFVAPTKRDGQSGAPSPDLLQRYRLVEVPVVVDGVQGFHQYRDPGPIYDAKDRPVFVKAATSSYAVHIEDISSPADREHWVAGTKWTVREVRTGAVLGEFVAYVIDPLQGQTKFEGGFGNAGSPPPPWERATHPRYARSIQNTCPEKDIYRQQLQSRDFVRSILVPKP